MQALHYLDSLEILSKQSFALALLATDILSPIKKQKYLSIIHYILTFVKETA